VPRLARTAVVRGAACKELCAGQRSAGAHCAAQQLDVTPRASPLRSRAAAACLAGMIYLHRAAMYVHAKCYAQAAVDADCALRFYTQASADVAAACVQVGGVCTCAGVVCGLCDVM
jgi:hypothetical protein